MYVPRFTAIDAEQSRRFVDEVGSGWLVTNSSGSAPAATLLPVLWRDDLVVGHIATANPHWRDIVDGDHGRLIVGGPEAYVSPSWYPSKVEHGKVVPTWNYLAVHLVGTVRVRHEPEWLLDVVTALTDRHEGGRDRPWSVDDAPAEFIARQLKAIVGIELQVTAVEGKAKLSQNRPADDRDGVIDGLLEQPCDPGSMAVADEMRRRRDDTADR